MIFAGGCSKDIAGRVGGDIVTDQDIQALREIEGPLFSYTVSNGGEEDITSDFHTRTCYDLDHDGTLTRSVCYNISDPEVTETTISDKDYRTVYGFILDSMDLGEQDLGRRGCDTPLLTFCYYDEEGERQILYRCDELGDSQREISDILLSYFD